MSVADIDHLVYGVPDLEQGLEDLHRRLGVRAAGTLQALGSTATVRMADAVAMVARVIGRLGVVVL